MPKLKITSKIFFATMLCLLLPFLAMSQSAPLSPYSRFGVGDLTLGQNPRNTAMGGVEVALASNRNISSLNPASYMNLDTLAIQFDLSFNVKFSTLQQQSGDKLLRSNSNFAGLSSISFNFPIVSWLKAAVGLKPISSIDYNVNRYLSSDDGSGDKLLKNSGSGGLSKAYIGLAGGFKYLSVGFNANYIFGSTNRNSQLFNADTLLFPYATSTLMNTYLQTQGFSMDFGILYKQPLGNKFLLGIGGSYTPQYNISVNRNHYIFSEGINYTDTIVMIPKEKGKIKMPQSYTVGFSFEQIGRWVIAGEYRYYFYSQYKEQYNSIDFHDPVLQDAWSAHLGAEFIGQRTAKSYFNRMFYRLGGNFSQNYVAFNDKLRNDWSVALGLGLPIKSGYSRIDISFEYGRTGSLKQGQIQEDFGRISVGFFGWDRWFHRRKFY